jgi:uncharacterized caspase-like protein
MAWGAAWARRLAPRLALALAVFGAALLAVAISAGLSPARAQSPATAEAPLPPPPETQAVRQRLALVVGIGRLGPREVQPAALRDARAIARALAGAGYEVISRENPGAGELRKAFAELRGKLKPDGLGLVYLVAPIAQVDGRNLIVAADAALNENADAPGTAALLRVVGVPVQEVLDTLSGPVDAPRVLVADGGWRIAPLDKLVPAGMARQRTLPGMVVMLGHVPGALHDLPVPGPEPAADAPPQTMAGSRLARVLSEALALPGITVTEALRAVRLSVMDGSADRSQPWLLGSLAARVFLSDPAPAPAAAAAGSAAPGAAASGAAASTAASTVASTAAAATTAAGAAAALATGAAPAVSTIVVPPPSFRPAAAPGTAPGTAPSTASGTAAPAAPPPGTAASAPASAASTAPAPAAAASAPTRPPTDGRTERAPGQGERPVLTSRTNRFGHAEGDVLSYDRLDVRKDELIESYVINIDRIAEDDGLVATGGRFTLDAEGRLLEERRADGSGTRYAPLEATWWARPVSGESRPLAFSEQYRRPDGSRGLIEWRGSSQVGTARLVELPAGEFEVLPIRSTGTGSDTAEGRPARALRFTSVVYFAPRLGMPVAMDLELDDADGRPLRRERVELTHAQQARTAR